MSLSLSRPNPHNVRSTGTLVSGNSSAGVAIFTGDELVPGDVRSARVMIANNGSLPGRFELFESDATNDFGAGELRLVIDDITRDRPATVFTGEFGGVPPEGIDLGWFEPRQSRRFRFLVMLNLNASNPQRDRGAGAAYEWRLASGGR
jgi:hypothetical protein